MGIVLDLSAKAADLHVDAAVDVEVTAPVDQIEQLVAAQHMLRMLDQRGQQVELPVVRSTRVPRGEVSVRLARSSVQPAK